MQKRCETDLEVLFAIGMTFTYIGISRNYWKSLTFSESVLMINEYWNSLRIFTQLCSGVSFLITSEKLCRLTPEIEICSIVYALWVLTLFRTSFSDGVRANKFFASQMVQYLSRGFSTIRHCLLSQQAPHPNQVTRMKSQISERAHHVPYFSMRLLPHPSHSAIMFLRVIWPTAPLPLISSPSGAYFILQSRRMFWAFHGHLTRPFHVTCFCRDAVLF